MSYDPRTVETKWQAYWKEHKTFEADPKPGTPKFLCTVPYPYVNGLPHVGHLFTTMRVEAMARYKRMRGFHTLFPQGWHCTGSPIVTAADRVAKNDPLQLQLLRDNSVAEDDLYKFKDPEFWVEYFPPRYGEDWRNLGLSIDWRREFITTSLNPRYDKFIRWQFIRLKEKNLVALGKHPIVWDPIGNAPVQDHDRKSGEGETPQEFVLILWKITEGARAGMYLQSQRSVPKQLTVSPTSGRTQQLRTCTPKSMDKIGLLQKNAQQSSRSKSMKFMLSTTCTVKTL